ncbi:serine/arginine repetitive matrix protein 1-like [Poecilia reticulata]|uniref:serine/arginine repetitive matrix protein 1-like n=1 Tax=Poecilia reticulata TaxID=8081 RepID=UPI0007EB0369|nr:PREDICTED: serine/arginine repetitive matrix protein 1-like [Poecilia reticulata]
MKTDKQQKQKKTYEPRRFRKRRAASATESKLLRKTRAKTSPPLRPASSLCGRPSARMKSRATEPPGCRAAGPPSRRTAGPPDHRAEAPPGRRTAGPPDHRAEAPPSRRAFSPSVSQSPEEKSLKRRTKRLHKAGKVWWDINGAVLRSGNVFLDPDGLQAPLTSAETTNEDMKTSPANGIMEEHCGNVGSPESVSEKRSCLVFRPTFHFSW